jgi:hypothetical protein
MRWSCLALLVLPLLAACGDFTPGPHPATMRAESLGGPVLAAPHLQPVFFANDDPAIIAQIADFLPRLGKSDYWSATTKEYGVGPATAAPPIQVEETVTGTITTDGISAWLHAKLASKDPAFPAPDASTVFILHYPPGVIVDGATEGLGCARFGGYHTVTSVAVDDQTVDVPFAVLPRCDTFGGLTGIDALTGAESHEILEAVTDPLTSLGAAWADVDADHGYWPLAVAAGELGDLCLLDPHAMHRFDELPFAVQRTWSNEAAAAGHDPCVPALPGVVYYNVIPVMNDALTLSVGGRTVETKGVKLPVGGSTTIDLALFGEASTGGPFNVRAFDFSLLQGRQENLTLTLDRTTGENGDTLHLTIEVLRADPSGAALFVVDASQGEASWHEWLGVVGQ